MLETISALWDSIMELSGPLPWLGGVVLGYVLNELFGVLQEKIWKIGKKMKINSKMKKLQSAHGVNDILLLASGYPYFDRKKFDIGFSENYVDCRLALPYQYTDRMPLSVGRFAMTNTEEMDKILSLLSTYGLTYDVLEKNQNEIAEKFLYKEDGMNFNGEKSGICYVDGFSRTCDNDETPILTMKFFKTDYFTHQVLTAAIRKQNITIIPGELKTGEKLFNTFCTALGMSIIVAMPSTNEIILTRRSKKVAFNEGKSWIYVSATEALTGTDNESNGEPSFEACIRRGLLEELGISEGELSLDSMTLYDVFFEKNFRQMGIVASVNLQSDITFDQIAQLRAKDKTMEIGELLRIKNTTKSINDFIKTHHSEMRAQAIFALKSYAARL